MNEIKSRVMTIANRLFKSGLTRSAATVRAWALAKAEKLRVKVTGTSLRQRALEKLAKFRIGELTAQLRREPRNKYDNNAVGVYAVTPQKTLYFIGYIARGAANVLAPLIDKGNAPEVKGLAIVGGFNDFVNYGARLDMKI